MRPRRALSPPPESDFDFDFGLNSSGLLPSQPESSSQSPGSAPLGDLTMAPIRTIARGVLVAPAGTSGAPTRIAESNRENRSVVLVAPIVGFSIYAGTSGVKIGDNRLPPGIPYEFVIPGLQELYAVTDAPVQLMLSVQIAPILVGDRERKYVDDQGIY